MYQTIYIYIYLYYIVYGIYSTRVVHIQEIYRERSSDLESLISRGRRDGDSGGWTWTWTWTVRHIRRYFRFGGFSLESKYKDVYIHMSYCIGGHRETEKERLEKKWKEYKKVKKKKIKGFPARDLRARNAAGLWFIDSDPPSPLFPRPALISLSLARFSSSLLAPQTLSSLASVHFTSMATGRGRIRIYTYTSGDIEHVTIL